MASRIYGQEKGSGDGDNRNFRTCPTHRAAVRHAPAEKLMRECRRRASSSCWSAASWRCCVALTRWPAVHLLPADWFYLVLTAHGANVLLFWIIFFEIAVLYFCSATLLHCRLATPKLAWLGFVLMVVGASRPTSRCYRAIRA